MTLKTGKIEYDLSAMRILATMAVIFWHTNNCLTTNYETFMLTSSQMYFFTACYYSVRWAVPAFMMITGILLLDSEKNYGVREIWHLCRRMILALFLFGVPYSIMEMVFTENSFQPMMIWRAIVNVIEGKSWDHLWYLYALIGFYLVLPILKIFSDHCTRCILSSILLAMAVFKFFLPLTSLMDFSVGISLPMQADFVFYPLLGLWMKRYVKVTHKAKCVCLFLFLLSIVSIIMLTYNDAATAVQNCFIPLLTVLVYCLIKDLKVEKTKEIIWKADRLCFTVYLIHPVFINFCYKKLCLTPAQFGTNFISVFLFWLSFTLLSFISAWLIYKIYPLKKFVL